MSEKFERVALQDARELEEFLELVRSENVRSYLEIGCKHGGSLWRVANVMPRDSVIVAVDLPHGDLSFKNSKPNLEACVEALKLRGYRAELIIGDSTSEQVVEQVRGLSPFDLVLIDANHTEPYIRKDWANYGPMARIVAFHDIAWQARPLAPGKLPIHVPQVWRELKQGREHREISYCPRDNGIGVLWNR